MLFANCVGFVSCVFPPEVKSDRTSLIRKKASNNIGPVVWLDRRIEPPVNEVGKSRVVPKSTDGAFWFVLRRFTAEVKMIKPDFCNVIVNL